MPGWPKMDSLPREIFEVIISLLTDAATVQTARLVCRKWKAATAKVKRLDWPEDYSSHPKVVKGERLTPLFPALAVVDGRTVTYPTSKEVPLTLRRGHLTLTAINQDLEWTTADRAERDKWSNDESDFDFDTQVADELTLLHRQLKVHGLDADLRLDMFSLSRSELDVAPHELYDSVYRYDRLAAALIIDYVKLRGDETIVSMPWIIADIPLDRIRQIHIPTNWKYGLDGHGAMRRWAGSLKAGKAKLAILHTRKTTYAWPPRSGDEIEEGWARSPTWLGYDDDQWIVKSS